MPQRNHLVNINKQNNPIINILNEEQEKVSFLTLLYIYQSVPPMAVKHLLSGLCSGHEAGKHSETHLLVDFHEVLRKGVHSSSIFRDIEMAYFAFCRSSYGEGKRIIACTYNKDVFTAFYSWT